MSDLDLDAIRDEFLNMCGACDGGLPMGCNCSDRDFRGTMSALVDRVRELEATVARVEKLVDFRGPLFAVDIEAALDGEGA